MKDVLHTYLIQMELPVKCTGCFSIPYSLSQSKQKMTRLTEATETFAWARGMDWSEGAVACGLARNTLNGAKLGI